ncbi:MAG: ABC transporter substrate binding protein [Gemmataceae bacterium]
MGGDTTAVWRSPFARGQIPLVIALAVSLCCPPATADPGTPRLVVGVYPNESDGAPGIILANQAIRTVFAHESADRIDVRNEYVDIARLSDPGFRQAQITLLQRKYAGRKVDLVIAGLSSGLDFVLQYREQVFPGAPVVFVAVDRREIADRRLPPDVIGVPNDMDLTGTLDLALRNHPDTQRVFVVAGAAAFDARWAEEARRAFAPYAGRVGFTYLTGLPMDDLLRQVAGLPAQSVVYYLHIFQDRNGATFIPADALERLAERATAPVYGHVDTYVGRGAVGGRVFSFEAAGENAARLALRVLAGEKPEAIGIQPVSGNAAWFDARQLDRWGLSETHLPPGSVVRFKEEAVWDVYKWRIIGAASVCLVVILLLAGLLAQRVRAHRADEQFRRVVETAPVGMLLVGRDGGIVMANAQVEKLFGYGQPELIGRPVEILVPERVRDRHPADREDYLAAPAARVAGQGREVSGRRKDGSEFPVEVGLSPLRTARGPLTLASVLDLTARKQAEDVLRETGRELQRLTGRLLEAQEGERRRIARELHDDLNQRLALLALELDLLGQKPPATATETATRTQELADQVRELASAVHDLSHRLHPSKLEHLGLVAAIASLCKELTQCHGLEVRFTHQSEPRAVPPDTALCLYRITQEALQNVVKHSGSRRVVVELNGTMDRLHLQVTDDGIGFDPDAAECRDGLGLVSMRERLNLIGGELVIESRPSAGARIDVHVPLAASDRADVAALQPKPAGR